MTSKKSKKSKRTAEKKPSKVREPLAIIEYYQPAFALILLDLAKSDYKPQDPHPKRKSFWQLIPDGIYEPYRARPLVEEYLKAVEKDMAQLISRNSIAYWLHIYRRLLPGPIGSDKQPRTTAITRATLEAAIQKYAQIEPCNGIGISSEIPEERILDGMLMYPNMKKIRQLLKENPQLVLTKFGLPELKEFYDLERLAFEVWKSGALLRIIGKGAPLIVEDDLEESIYDGRSDELNELVQIYDERLGIDRPLSATGTVFSDKTSRGQVLMPVYDVNSVSKEIFSKACKKAFGIQFPEDIITNFIWFPYNISEYLQTHEPFNSAFEEKHGVTLKTVVTVITCLLYRVAHQIRKRPEQLLVKYWQRAYEGPYKKDNFFEEIRRYLPFAIELLGLEGDGGDIDVPEGLRFLELSDESKDSIDLVYPGPHMILLPYGEDRVFIDYAWIHQRLYYLFHEIRLIDQNFKGEALEKLVHKGRSVLPTGPCRSLSGESKQIDAAFEVGDILIIVECKAVGRSIGFERGDPNSIRFRCDIIYRVLNEVDEKARWLALNPVGTNYDIRHIRRILPLGVTPFPEYIPTLDKRYWLKERLPRVLTPAELELTLKNGIIEKLVSDCPNSISISSKRT